MAIEIAMTRTLYCTVGDKFIDKYQFYVNMFRLVLISMNKRLQTPYQKNLNCYDF